MVEALHAVGVVGGERELKIGPGQLFVAFGDRLLGAMEVEGGG